MQLQKQYNLINKKAPANLPKENPTREIQINTPSSSQSKKYDLVRDVMEKGKSKGEPPKKIPEARKETTHQRGRKGSISF
jgi:hypothetical protein